ncbi:unnamed protein product [Rotaria magnacalcarata]|uniref:Uncharacterized protein n=2 Tax=Rotaria magnacalcarata TaxID=392030 RepID=A0A819VV57_9BILA|nr:unnamed protein product [Rotaria magnacalcarata]
MCTFNDERPFSRWWLVIIVIIQMMMAFVIILTEIGNILVDFWFTNVFAGLWTGLFIFASALSICCGVNCCKTSEMGPKCAAWLNGLSLVPLSLLIAFDIAFLVNPYMCILTPACASQTPLTSYQFMQNLPAFSNYTSYNSKKLFRLIQISCAGLAFILCIIYIVSYRIILKRIQLENTTTTGPVVSAVPTQGSTQRPPVNAIKTDVATIDSLNSNRAYPELPEDIPPWSISNPTTGSSLFSPPY